MHNDHFSKIKAVLVKGTLFFVVLFAVSSPLLVFGAEYNLLAPIPIGGDAPTPTNPNPADPLDINDPNPQANLPDVNKYIENGFLLAIALAGLFAVVRIVWAGITLMSTDAVSGRSAGKQIIQDAVLGFILAIAAYAILYTVNPRLLIFNLNPGVLGFSPPLFQPAASGTPEWANPGIIGINKPGGGGFVVVTPGTPPPVTPPSSAPLSSTLNIRCAGRIKPVGTDYKYGIPLGGTEPSLTSILGTVDNTNAATIRVASYVLTDDGLWWSVRFDGDTSDVYILEKTPSNPNFSAYVCAGAVLPPITPPGGGPITVGSTVVVVHDPSLGVYAGQGGTYLGEQSRNATGVVVSGPYSLPLTFGGSTTWWEIDYTSGVDGFSAEVDNNGSASPPTYLRKQ